MLWSPCKCVAHVSCYRKHNWLTTPAAAIRDLPAHLLLGHTSHRWFPPISENSELIMQIQGCETLGFFKWPCWHKDSPLAFVTLSWYCYAICNSLTRISFSLLPHGGQMCTAIYKLSIHALAVSLSILGILLNKFCILLISSWPVLLIKLRLKQVLSLRIPNFKDFLKNANHYNIIQLLNSWRYHILI